MNMKTAIGLLAIIILGATIANLIALKVAADQAKSQLQSYTANNGGTAGSVLGLLFGGNKGGG